MQSRAERAKIFKSFDSLKGFKDYLAIKERIIVDKKELSEDDYEELDRTFKQVKVGTMVRVIYFDKGEYVEKTGLVAKIDSEVKRIIQVVEKQIYFDDVYKIELI